MTMFLIRENFNIGSWLASLNLNKNIIVFKNCKICTYKLLYSQLKTQIKASNSDYVS